MKQKLFLVIFLLLFFQKNYSQVIFEKYILSITGVNLTSSEYGGMIIQTNDNGYIALGTCAYTSIGHYPAEHYCSLAKLDTQGDTVWSKNYQSDSLNLYGAYIEQTTDNGYIILVRMDSLNNSLNRATCIIKTDSLGNIMWYHKYKGITNYSNYAYQIHQTVDGGYCILDSPVVLFKIDNLGNLIWNRNFSMSGLISYGLSILQTADSGFIITGYLADSIGTNIVAQIIKTDSNGLLQWSKTYNAANSRACSICRTSDGTYVVCGSEGYPATTHILLFKIDASGNILWSKKIGNTEPNVGYSVIQDADQGFSIAGSTDFLPGSFTNLNACLVKTDSSGNFLWAKNYGDNITSGFLPYQEALFLKRTLDNGYFLSSYIYYPPFNSVSVRLYAIKTDSSGNSGCTNGNVIMTSPNLAIAVSSPTTTVSCSEVMQNISIIQGSDSICAVTICYQYVGISEVTMQEDELTIYPNPANNQLTVKSEQLTVKEIKVYDVMGETVYSEQLTTNNTTIDVSGLASGLYFLQVNSEQGTVNRKFVKE